MWHGIRPTRRVYGIGAGVVASVALVVGALTGHGELDITEVLGFVSGAVSVWLTVEENVWLWPVSIANNVFFFVLFGRAGLFADAGLQLVYIVLEIIGWVWWAGRHSRARLEVHRASQGQLLAATGVVVLATAPLTALLIAVSDTAPFLDALTTAMSLVATWMLAKKLLENWWLWIVADVIYIGLYTYKHLVLTAVLYAVFLAMCIAGIRNWRVLMRCQALSLAGGAPSMA